MTRPKQKRLAERTAGGEYELIVPLDYKILADLQDEGTMLAEMYEIGTSAREVQKHYPMISTGTISGRLRVMMEQGLTRKVKLVGTRMSGAAWQRTKEGARILKEWQDG